MIVSLTLPWPPADLSPNARTRSCGKKARAIAQYRKRAATLCWDVGLRPESGAVPVSITFRPRRASQDKDNAIAWFKAGQDGIADALGANDNDFDTEYHMGSPMKGGAVVVSFEIPD